MGKGRGEKRISCYYHRHVCLGMNKRHQCPIKKGENRQNVSKYLSDYQRRNLGRKSTFCCPSGAREMRKLWKEKNAKKQIKKEKAKPPKKITKKRQRGSKRMESLLLEGNAFTNEGSYGNNGRRRPRKKEEKVSLSNFAWDNRPKTRNHNKNNSQKVLESKYYLGSNKGLSSLISKVACKNCGGNLIISKFCYHGKAPSMKVHINCSKCSNKFSQDMGDNKNPFLKAVLCGVLTGNGKKGIEETMKYLNIPMERTTQFQEEFNKACDIVDDIVKESVERQRREVMEDYISLRYDVMTGWKNTSLKKEEKIKKYAEKFGKVVKIIGGVDGSYSHRRNAKWGYVNFCEFVSGKGKVIYRNYARIKTSHSDRKSMKKHKNQTIETSSVHIEPTLMKKMLMTINEASVTLCGITFDVELMCLVLDGDTKNDAMIKGIFPKCHISRCYTHKQKNLKKLKILTQVRCGSLASKAFVKCLRIAKGDIKLFKRLLSIYPKHFYGDHSTCIGNGCSKAKKRIKSEKAFDVMVKVFNELSEKADLYVNMYSVNWNESLHQSQVKHTDGKHKFFARNQNSLASVAVLKRNEGWIGVKELFIRMKCYDEFVIEYLKKWDVEKSREADRKKDEGVKRRRILSKNSISKKARVGNKNNNVGEGYKGCKDDSDFGHEIINVDDEVIGETEKQITGKKRKRKKPVDDDEFELEMDEDGDFKIDLEELEKDNDLVGVEEIEVETNLIEPSPKISKYEKVVNGEFVMAMKPDGSFSASQEKRIIGSEYVCSLCLEPFGDIENVGQCTMCHSLFHFEIFGDKKCGQYVFGENGEYILSRCKKHATE